MTVMQTESVLCMRKRRPLGISFASIFFGRVSLLCHVLSREKKEKNLSYGQHISTSSTRTQRVYVISLYVFLSVFTVFVSFLCFFGSSVCLSATSYPSVCIINLHVSAKRNDLSFGFVSHVYQAAAGPTLSAQAS